MSCTRPQKHRDGGGTTNFQAGCQCTSKPLPGPCRDMKDTVSSSQSRHFSLSLNHHVGGERERSSPLPEIVQSRFLHLRNSQGSARPECNGRVQWPGQTTFLIIVSPLPGKYELYKTELALAFLAKGSTGTVGAPPTFRQAANAPQAPQSLCQGHAGI